MKVAFIFGKGIDGCGVTRGALIFEKWLIEEGHDTLIINFDNAQKMLRARNIDFSGETITVDSKEELVCRETISKINQVDIAIFHSYPTRKQFAYVERFRKFVEQVRDPIKVMHDHGVSANTINAIPQAGEMFCHADVVVPQSLTGNTIKSFSVLIPGLAERCIENPIWLEPDSLSPFDLPFEERRKVLNYTGRSSPIKQVALVPNTIPYLLDEGWTGELIGAERSINAMSDEDYAAYHPKNRHMIQYWAVQKARIANRTHGGFLGPEVEKPPILAIDRYQHSDGMARLGSCLASWAGYRLTGPENYGSRMEYTQLEAFLLTVPIISRSFSEEAKSPDGKFWGEYDCALVSCLGEEEALAENLLRLESCPKEWKERHAACKDLVYKFNDVQRLAPQFLNQVLSLGKRSSYANFMEFAESWWPEAKDLREGGEIIMSSSSGVEKRRKLLLEGRKQKEI